MVSKESVVCTILLGIVYTCTLASANYGAQQKPISVVLKGRVVCDPCSLEERKFSDTNDIISGAVVAVKCSRGLNRKTNAGLVSIEGETNENGEFKVELPSSVIPSILLSSSSDDHNSILKGYCSVRVLSSSPEKCNAPFPITSSSDLLTLTSDCHGIRTFTFPSLIYGPQSKLLCSHRDITGSSDHESLLTGRVLHEVRKGSSNAMDASFPHVNFPPMPKPELGFPPLPKPKLGFPHPHGFPPLHLPHPHHRPVLSFPPLPASFPPLPASIPYPASFPPLPASIAPVPASIPYPGPTLSP